MADNRSADSAVLLANMLTVASIVAQPEEFDTTFNVVIPDEDEQRQEMPQQQLNFYALKILAGYIVNGNYSANLLGTFEEDFLGWSTKTWGLINK